MNYPQKQFDKLITYLPKVIAYYNLNKEDISNGDIALLHDLHFSVYTNTNYNDDNIHVKLNEGKRLLPIDKDFLLYPEKCNDNQIETAMKNAIKTIYK